jgi:probable HAF family extracellular repeat protein
VCLFAALAMPVGMVAQDNPSQDHKSKHHQYKLIDLGTFGGPNSSFPSLNHILTKHGAAAGGADTSVPDPEYPNFDPFDGPDPFIQHAFLWQNGIKTDLGALPGVNTSYPSGINARGQVCGASRNGLVDPITGLLEAVAVLWREGGIVELGSLGGNFSLSTGINSRAQVTGTASNPIPDPFSLLGVGTQARAFLWNDGVMHDLGTLGGPDSFAEILNDRGQVAGESYTNSIPNGTTGVPTIDPFLWDDGQMRDLGILGGTIGHSDDLNNHGQVAGYSNLAGDLTTHPTLWSRGALIDLGTLGGDNGFANVLNESGDVVGKADLAGSQTHDGFLWRNGVMTDLGTVPGDPCSNAYGINSQDQVVGASSDCQVGLHAFLWENSGPMIDLNTLISPGSGLQLTYGLSINERGEIAGIGLLANGDQHAFLLIPCDENHPGECQDYSMIEVATPQTSSTVHPQPRRKQGSESPISPVERFRSMMRQHYHIPSQPAAPRD